MPLGFDEVGAIRRAYDAIQEQTHFFISIMPTLDCNMRCEYCFETRQKLNMKREDGLVVLALIRQLPGPIDSITVDWYGGEPLLRFNFIRELQREIVDIVRKKGLDGHYSMTTNGVLLTEERAKALVACGLTSFQVTLDGPPEVHNRRRKLASGEPSFDRIMTNVKAAAQHCRVTLRVNVDRSNLDSLSALIDEVVYRHMTDHVALTFKAIVPPGGHDTEHATFSEEEFAAVIQPAEYYAISRGCKLYTEPRKICEFCPVDLPTQWMIGPDLKLYKCGESYATSGEVVGFLRKDGTIQTNEHLQFWRQKPIFTDPDCVRCVYLPQCMGGCSLKKLVHKKNWCPKEKYSLEWYVQMMYETTRRGR